MKVSKRFGDITKTVPVEVTHQYRVHYWPKADQERYAKTGVHPKGGSVIIGYCRGKAALDTKVAKIVADAKRGVLYRANMPFEDAPHGDDEIFVTITEAEGLA